MVTSADLISSMISVMEQDTQLQQPTLTKVRELRTTVTEFIKFYNQGVGNTERIPYPYRLEAQEKYSELSTIISSALEVVETVVYDMKDRLFRLERNQATPENFAMSMQESQPEIMMAGQPKPNPLQRLMGVKRKKIVNKNDPYQSSIPFFKRAYHLVDYWDIHKERQDLGTQWEEDEMNRFGYQAWLKNHISLFTTEIEPDLLRIYQQGLTLRRMIEKQSFTSVLQRSLSELRQQEQQQMHR